MTETFKLADARASSPEPRQETSFGLIPYMAYDAVAMFEQLVLVAILRLGDEAYAIPLREEIERRTGRSIARGALYTALERLEAKQFVTSRMSEPRAERGGRSRRYYAVTPAGLEAIKAARHSLLQLWQGLEGTLER